MKILPKYCALVMSLSGLGLISALGNVYASDGEFPSNKADVTLDNLAKVPTPFPACNTRDYNWVEQDGPDQTHPPLINKNMAVIEADQIMGQESGVHYASGNVVGYKDDKTVVADWLIYDQQKAHATGGNVILSRQYNVVQGKWVDYYMDLDKGVLKEAQAKNIPTNMTLQGKQINVSANQKYDLVKGLLTSCSLHDPAWHITADSAHFDYNDNQGYARGATLYAKSFPVMYSPYFRFPLGRRRSGFLTPNIGSGNAGFFYDQPYYWNMAPNYDMTVDARVYTIDGFMLTDQFRYLNESGKGEMYTEQVPNTWNNGQYRYLWRLTDDHTLFPNVTGGYNYNSVSDNNYMIDFGGFLSTVSNINLEQSAYMQYQPQWGLAKVRMLSYQTLQPSGQPQSSPIYAIEPQVDFNINPQSLGVDWIKLGMLSQYSSFRSGGLQSGDRSMIYPSLTMPLKQMWGFVTPKLGYSYTQYSLSPFYGFQNSYTVVNRGLPISSVDSGLTFERPFSFTNRSYVQTLEPRLYYLYIPAVNQGNIPAFDTAIASPNLNQLFSENRFSGYDRINAANDITMGLTSRMISGNTGAELANWGVGYRYSFVPSNDLIYGAYSQFQQLYQPTPNAIAELGNKWANSISTNINFQYDTLFQLVDTYAFQVKYNPDPHKLINLRYTYQYKMPLLYYAYVVGQPFATNFENQYALDLSGQWPLFSEHWLVDARANYDFTQQRYLNIMSGVEYDGGCWAVRALYESYLTGYAGATNTQVNINNVNYSNVWYLQFVLKGLSTVDVGQGDPSSELNVNIPGYAPITTIH